MSKKGTVTSTLTRTHLNSSLKIQLATYTLRQGVRVCLFGFLFVFLSVRNITQYTHLCEFEHYA